MASLKRIEALATRLNHEEPKWIRGYSDEHRISHLSGALREASLDVWGHRTGVAHEVLTPEELALTSLLDDAAEALDDAHEEWLNMTLAARDLVGDINAMHATGHPIPSDEGWFGSFSVVLEIDSPRPATYVEWPNLGITVDALTQVLRGKEYKL